MTSLKELTWDSHKKAETTQLSKELAKNTISPQLYCDLVYTQYQIFSAIENRVNFSTSCLPRAQHALDDWTNIKLSLPKDLPAIDAYLNRIRTCDDRQIWGHIYVNYMGLLFGGQIIKKQIGGRFPTSLFDFDDAQSCIAEIRQNTGVDLADEANLSFNMIVDYYNELYNNYKSNS